MSSWSDDGAGPAGGGFLRGTAAVVGALATLAGWIALLVVALGQLAVRRGPGTSAILALFAGATPVLALGGFVATVEALLRHHWRRSLAGLALCAVAATSLAPAVRAQEPAPAWATAPGAAVVRILAVNPYFLNRDPRMAPTIAERARDVDVVVVVELERRSAEWLLMAERDFLGMFPFTVRADDVMVFSRHPLEDVRRVDAGGAVASVVVRAPQPFRLVGVHTKAPLHRRAIRQHEAFFDWAAGEFERSRSERYPLVMAGDFNAARWQAPMTSVLRSGARDAHELVGRPFATTWPTGLAGLPVPPFLHLDHVLVNDGVAVRAVEDVRIPGSDHESVLAELVIDPTWRVDGSAAPSTPRPPDGLDRSAGAQPDVDMELGLDAGGPPRPST